MFTFVIAKIDWKNFSMLKTKKNLNSDITLNSLIIISLSSILYLGIVFFGYLFSTYIYDSIIDAGKNISRYSLPVSLSIGYLSLLIYNNLSGCFKLKNPNHS